MKYIQVLLVVVAAVCHAREIALYSDSDEVGRGGQIMAALQYIGDPDTTKTLFMDKTVALSWADAKKHCPAQTPSGTRIAPLSATDYAFLETKKADIGNGQILWTSGRDVQDWTWTQFKWDNATDTAAVSVAGLKSNETLPFYQIGFKTCVAFMIMKDGSSARLAGLDCAAKYGVLCQLDKPAAGP